MIEVQTLGRLRILRNGLEVHSLQAQTLPLSVLVYVGVEREATRDELIQLFWPGRDSAKAKHALNQVLHRLRRDVGDDWCVTVGPLLRARPSLSVDAVEFLTASQRGRRSDALSFYGGPFLAGFSPDHVDFEHWIEATRASLGKTFRTLIRYAIADHSSASEPSLALESARQWYDVEPDEDEAAHELIRLTALTGDRTSALRVYDAYCRRLEREGLAPLKQTEDMVSRIRNGDSPEADDAITVVGGGGRPTAGTSSEPTTRPPTERGVEKTSAWPTSPKAGPRLVRIVEHGQEAEAYLLRQPRTVIGREEGDLMFSSDALLSTPHAAILQREIEAEDGRTEARHVLRDLGSSHGVFVRIRHPWPLREGHVFMVGDQLFRVDSE